MLGMCGATTLGDDVRHFEVGRLALGACNHLTHSLRRNAHVKIVWRAHHLGGGVLDMWTPILEGTPLWVEQILV